MGLIGTILFWGAIIVIAFRKSQWIGISKKSWLLIGFAMFSTAFLFFTGAALSSGKMAFYALDNPFFTFTFTRIDHPVIFYIGVTGIALVGIFGWISTIKHLIHK